MRISVLALIVLLAAVPAAAQVPMPDPRAMSGMPLPNPELPAGTITVRVVRGAVSNNLPDQPVEFTVDGETRIVRTGEDGRARLDGLPVGARVTAVTVVDGERIPSQEVVMPATGVQMILAASDPDAARREAEDRALAEAPAVKGIVVLGPESRVIVELGDSALRVFYVMQILNTARTPVDIGGPLIVDLPREARGTTIMQGSSPQATAVGARVIVTGPFAPGPTIVQSAYELPYSGPTATVEQVWPATLQQVLVLLERLPGMEVASPQIAERRSTSSEGTPLVVGTGPAIAAGESLVLEFSGLPHRSPWPRTLTLSLAGLIMAAGIWGAVTARPGRRR